jgi:hypothetical protein
LAESPDEAQRQRLLKLLAEEAARDQQELRPDLRDQ